MFAVHFRKYRTSMKWIQNNFLVINIRKLCCANAYPITDADKTHHGDRRVRDATQTVERDATHFEMNLQPPQSIEAQEMY